MTQIAILLYPGMTALDAIGPYELLNTLRGRELRFVAKHVGPIVTDSGALVLGATHSFEQTLRPDLVLVPGSSAATARTMADAETLQWLRAVHPHTRFTTSVCTGALILAAAGLLEGLSATTHWAGMSVLERFGVTPRPNDRIVREGKVFTAAGVSAGLDLALTLLAELDGDEAARRAQLMIEYDPQPPFDSGHLTKADGKTKRGALAALAMAAASPAEALAVPKLLMTRFRQLLA
ncbi:MAG: DJ-1/PfpI family protein [Myxococcota bacterium]